MTSRTRGCPGRIMPSAPRVPTVSAAKYRVGSHGGPVRHQRTSSSGRPLMSDQQEQLRTTAEKLGIGNYRRHVLLCTGPSCCTTEEGMAAWDVLKGQIKEKNLGAGENACYRTKVGCLRVCCH